MTQLRSVRPGFFISGCWNRWRGGDLCPRRPAVLTPPSPSPQVAVGPSAPLWPRGFYFVGSMPPNGCSFSPLSISSCCSAMLRQRNAVARYSGSFTRAAADSHCSARRRNASLRSLILPKITLNSSAFTGRSRTGVLRPSSAAIAVAIQRLCRPCCRRRDAVALPGPVCASEQPSKS